MSELVNDSGLIAISAAASKSFAPFIEFAEKLRTTANAVAEAYTHSPHYKKRKAQDAYCTVRTISPTHKEAQCAGLARIDQREQRRTTQQQWASPLELLANSLTSHAPPYRPESNTGLGTG